jgi:hypothetical protein
MAINILPQATCRESRARLLMRISVEPVIACKSHLYNISLRSFNLNTGL